nr:immunoglobulin light chain junction region [Macaca mulatta]
DYYCQVCDSSSNIVF